MEATPSVKLPFFNSLKKSKGTPKLAPVPYIMPSSSNIEPNPNQTRVLRTTKLIWMPRVSWNASVGGWKLSLRHLARTISGATQPYA